MSKFTSTADLPWKRATATVWSNDKPKPAYKDLPGK